MSRNKPRRTRSIPIVPQNPRSRGSIHTPKPKKAPKHKTNWSRLDDLYQE